VARRLDTLTPGDRFVVTGTGRKATLLRLGSGSALVAYDAGEKKFQAHDANGDLVEINFKNENVLTISLGTMVQRLVVKKKKRRKQ
jgi:hypothetical protein